MKKKLRGDPALQHAFALREDRKSLRTIAEILDAPAPALTGE